VRYEFSEAPEQANYCHCRMCQRATGGPFAAFGTVKVSAFTWTKGAPTLYASSDVAKRGFCNQCGTPLSFQYNKSQYISFTIGSFDEPDAIAPTAHLGCEDQVSWLHIMDDLPKDTTPFGSGTPTDGMVKNQSKV